MACLDLVHEISWANLLGLLMSEYLNSKLLWRLKYDLLVRKLSCLWRSFELLGRCLKQVDPLNIFSLKMGTQIGSPLINLPTPHSPLPTEFFLTHPCSWKSIWSDKLNHLSIACKLSHKGPSCSHTTWLLLLYICSCYRMGCLIRSGVSECCWHGPVSLHPLIRLRGPVLLARDGAHSNTAEAMCGCFIKGLQDLSCWLWACSWPYFRQGLWCQNIFVRGPVTCPSEEVEYNSYNENLYLVKVSKQVHPAV